ncbi:uncharacterized protein LOC126185069 [Schistocerca cancellata]|uniref:uncharacterized protein LOC126185069 n=1 Tax=Schistocerca cancellata TaxID=274614 RepID=UPI00211979A4|nr:uncharacterized protein LOC126185069 [Schistocerca cancellata]XP_049783791.1 uncharacterized protein LOC126185069 [Schistocerca cancellata]
MKMTNRFRRARPRRWIRRRNTLTRPYFGRMCKWRTEYTQVDAARFEYGKMATIEKYDENAQNFTTFKHYDITDEFKFFANKYNAVIINKIVTYVYRINVRVERLTLDDRANKKFYEDQGALEKVRIACTNKLGPFSLKPDKSSGVPWRKYSRRNAFKFVTYCKPETSAEIGKVKSWVDLENQCKCKNKLFQGVNPFYIGVQVAGDEPDKSDVVQSEVKYVTFIVRNRVYMTFCKRKGTVTF